MSGRCGNCIALVVFTTNMAELEVWRLRFCFDPLSCLSTTCTLSSFVSALFGWVIGAGFALEGVQMYTFVIYRQILRKVMPRRNPQAGGLAIGTPVDSPMSSPERQSSFVSLRLSS